MKMFLTILATLAVATGLAMLAIDDPGYVVLAREPYTVRLPLLLFIMFVLVGFVLLYLLINFIVGLIRAPKRYRTWRTHANENNAQKHTMQGYAGLIEGNWSSAEAALLKKLEYNRVPLLNYLGAAYAAQQQGELGRRDQYLDEAQARHTAQQLPINLTRARLQYHAGEFAEARNTLENVVSGAPRNAPAIRLLSDVYADLGDWKSFTALLPAMKKSRAFNEEEMETREALAYDNLMASPALQQGEENRVQTTWKSLPAARRKNPATIGSYAKQLIASGDIAGAESVLRTALKKNFSSELMQVYGKIESPAPGEQLKFLETLNRNHPEDPLVVLAMARHYHRQNDLVKSKEYYEQAIAAGAGEEACFGLSSLLERAGKLDSALYFLKKGVGSALDAPLNPETLRISGEVVESDTSTEGAPVRRSEDPMPVVK